MAENIASGGVPEETLCPSCGKFIGAYARCPYCGTKAGKRMSIKFFRIFAIAMSLGGVFIVWLAARGVDAPLVKVEEIGPSYNFGVVRVEGEVSRARVPRWGGLEFTVDDGTGKLKVVAYGEMGEKIIAAGRFPSDGDRVSVEGSMQVSGGARWPKMIVNVPEKIRITEEVPDAPLSTISSLNRERHGETVRVEGEFVSVRKFPKGTALILKDESGTLEIVVWDGDRKRLGPGEKLLEEGRRVSVQGKLGEYRDKLQIVLKRAGDIRELEE